MDTLPLSFLPASVGPLELALVLIVALVLFGPKKLPEAARKLGRAASLLRRAMDEFSAQVRTLEEESLPSEKSAIPQSAHREGASDERSADSQSPD